MGQTPLPSIFYVSIALQINPTMTSEIEIVCLSDSEDEDLSKTQQVKFYAPIWYLYIYFLLQIGSFVYLFSLLQIGSKSRRLVS